MATKRRMKYEDGVVAIYDIEDTAIDDDPLTDPLDNVDRLHFHSDLPMPAVVKVAGNFKTTGSITIAALNTRNVFNSVRHELFAHGQPGTPIVFGRITQLGGSSVSIPFAGSVPLMRGQGDLGPNNANHNSPFWRWCHLGADDTYVILRVVQITGNALSGATTVETFPSSLALHYEVSVTNFLLDEPQPDMSDPDVLLRMEPDRFSAGEGKFDSERRYMRIDASGGLAIPSGLSTKIENRVPQGHQGPRWRYNVDTWDQRLVVDSIGGLITDSSLPNFTAAFSRFKLY